MNLESINVRWAGRCIVAGSGPSLTPEVAEACRGERVIAINDAYRLMPWADVLYSCDASWWTAHNGCPDFQGEKWTSHSVSPANDKTKFADKYRLRVVKGVLKPGFSADPEFIHYGRNSGFQAVNLALLWGADPVILVGFDMRLVSEREHFFGNHQAPLRPSGPFSLFIGAFEKAAKETPMGERILNATPGSGLTCFPMVDLADALSP